MLSLVSLAHKVPRVEASHPALQTTVPSEKWLPNTSAQDHVQELRTTLNSRWRRRVVCRNAPRAVMWSVSRAASPDRQGLHFRPAVGNPVKQLCPWLVEMGESVCSRAQAHIPPFFDQIQAFLGLVQLPAREHSLGSDSKGSVTKSPKMCIY